MKRIVYLVIIAFVVSGFAATTDGWYPGIDQVETNTTIAAREIENADCNQYVLKMTYFKGDWKWDDSPEYLLGLSSVCYIAVNNTTFCIEKQNMNVGVLIALQHHDSTPDSWANPDWHLDGYLLTANQMKGIAEYYKRAFYDGKIAPQPPEVRKVYVGGMQWVGLRFFALHEYQNFWYFMSVEEFLEYSATSGG